MTPSGFGFCIRNFPFRFSVRFNAGMENEELRIEKHEVRDSVAPLPEPAGRGRSEASGGWRVMSGREGGGRVTRSGFGFFIPNSSFAIFHFASLKGSTPE